MKRIIALSFLIGIVAFGLMSCLRESESTTNNEDTTVAVVDNGAEIVAVADTESVDAEENVGDAETPVVANATEIADDGTRGPILVLGNADFTSDNGVVGGTGTENDPYIIAGWEIIVPAGEQYGVRIENVTAQFVLRGLIIRDATENSGSGIRIGFASGGAIEGCSISSSLHGIDIISSTDISMDNCVVQVSGRGFRVVGESEDQYRHAIADTNLYNNNPIYYFYGLENDTISDLRGGHLTVAGSRNVTISNNEIVNGDGLLLAFVEDSTITLNVVHRTANVITDYGIHLYESHNNEVMENGIKNNRLAGLQLTLSNSNTIVNNEIYVNDTGIRLLASDDNEAFGNLIISNATGILALGGASGNRIYENLVIDNQGNMAQGIVLETSMSNEVQRNLIFDSENGIMLEAQAFGNSVTDNTVVSCGYGLYVSGTNNTIEGNLLSQHAQGILFPETF
ncbi:right-handed parallel beta-helix repeat-containing protein, partial [Candidatus Bipolaricaulota bacterium]|nr:right-handed parallel beta-helix repeat-containing protein [Candidatus Bipolaricaulota bacterium]